MWYLQSNMPMVATQGEQKTEKVAVIHKVFNTAMIVWGGGGGF